MVEVRAATNAEADSWLADWRERLHRWYARHGVGDEWVNHEVKRRLSNHTAAPQSFVFVVTAGEENVGFLAVANRVSTGSPSTAISDLWTAPDKRGLGYGSAALRWVRSWATSQARRLTLVTDPSAVAAVHLAREFPLRAQQMVKRASSVDSLPGGLVARPMTDADFEPWQAKQVQEYAQEMVDSGLLPLAEATVQATKQVNEYLPDGLRTAGTTFWCLQSDTEVIATLCLGHHDQPGVTWVHKVEVTAEQRGQGYGRAAMMLAEQQTVANGDSHIGLNVFAHNPVAIRLYDGLAYQTVDQFRSIEL